MTTTAVGLEHIIGCLTSTKQQIPHEKHPAWCYKKLPLLRSTRVFGSTVCPKELSFYPRWPQSPQNFCSKTQKKSLSQQSGKTSQAKPTITKSTQSNFSVRFKALEVQSHLVPSTFPWFDECRACPATSPALPFQSRCDQRKSPRRKLPLESRPNMPGTARQGQQ